MISCYSIASVADVWSAYEKKTEGYTVIDEVQAYHAAVSVAASVATLAGVGLMLFAMYWMGVGIEKIQYAQLRLPRINLRPLLRWIKGLKLRPQRSLQHLALQRKG